MSSVGKSIVVPCYNEAKNLPNLIARFAAIHESSSDWEVVLVDNGSVDGNAEVFAREQVGLQLEEQGAEHRAHGAR